MRTIWARSVVRDLEDEYASYSADDELAAQLVAHSVRFGVLSRFTAFVAIDPECTEAGPLTEVMQPVEQPSGWASNVGNVGFVRSAGLHAFPGSRRDDAGSRWDAAGLRGRCCAGPAAEPAGQGAAPVGQAAQAGGEGHPGSANGLDTVLDELEQHRDATTEIELRAALRELCAALARFLQNPTAAQSRQLLVAIDAVKLALAGAGGPRRRWFWT